MKTLLFIVSVGTIGALVWPTAPDSEAGPSAGPPVDIQVQEHVLDNGFTILLVEDHRAPRVAANLWVRVGSMLEPEGLHGIVHFLEHVIHQGTTTIGTRDLDGAADPAGDPRYRAGADRGAEPRPQSASRAGRVLR